MFLFFITMFSVLTMNATHYKVVSVEENVMCANKLTDKPAAVCVTVEEYNQAQELAAIKKYYGYRETLTYPRNTVLDSLKYYVLRGIGIIPRVLTYEQLPAHVQEVAPEFAGEGSWIVAVRFIDFVPAQGITERWNNNTDMPVNISSSTSILDQSVAEQMVIALP